MGCYCYCFSIVVVVVIVVDEEFFSLQDASSIVTAQIGIVNFALNQVVLFDPDGNK